MRCGSIATGRELRRSAAIERALDQDRHGVDTAGAEQDFSLEDAVAGEPRAAQPSADEGVDSSDSASPGSGIGQSPTFFHRLPIITKIATGPADRASLTVALVGGAAYCVLACLSLWLADAGGNVSPVWLPNACAVALLLRTRLGNELPFLLACFAASLVANAVLQLPDRLALLFSIANVVEIVVVLALTRTAVHGEAKMDHLSDLARFVWAGGLVGPLVSAILTAPVIGANFEQVRAGGVAWFLSNSTAMVLIVPTALLLFDRLRAKLTIAPSLPAERISMLVGCTGCTYLVFDQNHYSLMFLIPPFILLHAFRVGSLGSALQICAVAVVAGVMTYAGEGPIAAATRGGIAQLHLFQAFVAVNFLTGLPVAAILAGHSRMLTQLAVSKHEVDLLAQNISDAILRYDLDGVCTYASPSARDVIEEQQEILIGSHVGARLHPDTRDRTTEAFARLFDGSSEHERVTYRRFDDDGDGSPVFLEADCALVRHPETGAPEGVVVAVRDVTERVELELLLTRARRHAENAARAKSEFLANMSHEIRTPMNGVLGFAELMLQGELAEDQRRFAELIVQSGRSMMMLLNDVLDLSKIESGQFAIDRAPVDLAACLGECAALHQPAATRKGLTLEIAWDGSEGGEGSLCAVRNPWVLTDGLRLRQILLNLIGNAVKFTEQGHICIGYRVSRYEMRVTVADSGIGISPLQLEAIFNPFTQGETDTARRFGGTGLGLSISRQLAGLLGGRIEVESAPGEGSLFTVVLPATLAPPLQEEAHDPLSGEQPFSAALVPELLGPSRILLVEDHDINRILVTEMLERCGQDVAVAHDGNEGIAMVIDSIMRGRPYDLVLMDVQMPGCDGLAATRAIREEGIGPDLLPIIALTANAFAEDVTAARESGMQGHLAKPVVFAKLARTLQRWLPTRIVEDEAQVDELGARASQLARSPRLVARWEARRRETLDAVDKALAEGWVDNAEAADAEQRTNLARLLHKLAGTAALFDESELGEVAGALERALVSGSAGSAALAKALLELGTAPGAAQEADRTHG